MQMQNRGNGKGGGIAAAGLVPEQWASPREVLESHYLLQIALLDPDVPRRAGAGVRPAPLRRRAVHPAAAHRRLSRHPRPGGAAARRPPLRGAGQAGRARRPSPRPPGCRIWRRARSKTSSSGATPTGSTTQYYASLGEKRAFVLSHGTEPAGLQAGGLRRAERGVLPAPGFQGPRLDRPPALSHQGPRVAPRRRAPVRGRERGAGPQRRLRQLPFGLRVPAPAQHPPAVPHRHRGVGAALRPVGPGLQVPAGIHHRGAGAHHRARLRPAAAGEAAHLPADPGDPHPRVAGRPLVLHHRPQPWTTGSSCWASPTPPCCARRCSPCPTGRGPDRPHLLGEAGHRRHPAQPGRGGPALLPVADRYWNARGGSSTDGGAFIFTVAPGDERRQRQMRLSCADKFGREVKVDTGHGPLRPARVRDRRRVGRRLRRRHAERRRGPGEAARRRRGRSLSRRCSSLPAWPAGELRRFCHAVACRGGQPQRHRAPPSSC